MYLRKYQDSDFSLLAQWVTSPALLFQFAGTDFSFPLTQNQLEQYQAACPDCLFYIACRPLNEPIAFGEIIPQANNIPRLGRLLVGNTAHRGKGIGAAFVQLLVAECARLFNCTQIELYVLSDNKAAQRCYEKVGFYYIPGACFQLQANGVTHTIQKMRLDIR